MSGSYINVDVNLNDVKQNSCFQNLYHVKNAVGSSLTFGLRSFNRIFADKVLELELENQKLAATTLKVVKIILNIVVYPVLCPLALIGVMINKCHLEFHNRSFKKSMIKAVEEAATLTKNSTRFSDTSNTITTNRKMSKGQTGCYNSETISKFREKCLAKLHKDVNAATSAGLFIAKVELDARDSCNLFMDSINMKLKIVMHQPEIQDLREMAIKKAKEIIALS